MLDAGAAPSRSFSYANAGATADSAMADAKAIVTIFTVQLRCLGQDESPAGAACDANARHTQVVNASQNLAFRSRKCHGRSDEPKKVLAINHSPGTFRRNDHLRAASSFPHNKLAMR
jgi:hypothetical protein